MTKDLYNLKHALHNEQVCQHLLTGIKCDDWIIITAFYSALKFASHKIFPFKVPSIDGKTTSIESIDQYMRYDNHKDKSKHQLLVELVEKHCVEIAESYSKLLDMSMSARYKAYHHDPAISAQARTLLQKIKKSCATNAEIESCTI